MDECKFIVGIDEVGRGPLAGPVAVGACLISAQNNKKLADAGFFENIRDSKKLSEKKREEWLDKMDELRIKGDLDYSVAFVSNKIIDEKGIAHSIRFALRKALEDLTGTAQPDSVQDAKSAFGQDALSYRARASGRSDEEMLRPVKSCLNANFLNTMVLLDGGLKAPEEFVYQRTIIKGDEKEPIISLASIAAKVVRDRIMTEYSKQFPWYGFETHKGYGTLIHRQNIKKRGLSELHRKSFCKNLV